MTDRPQPLRIASGRRATALMAAFLVAVVATLALSGSAGPPVGAQETPATTPSIIPLPGSGADPQREGDRGSATQYGVLFGTMGAMALIAGLVYRESRKHKDRQTPKPAAAPLSSEPVASEPVQ